MGPAMSRSAVLASILLALAPTFASADVPVIQNTSLVRVRADNRFGVAKQNDLMPFVGMDTGDAISDTETGTAASSSCSATYRMTLSGTTLTIAIQALQAASASAHGNLAEGFIHFTLSEPYEYILSGGLNGSGADPGDGYQQRTFLRLFQSPFTTVFLEDETGFGSAVSLAVNQANDAGAGGSTTSPARAPAFSLPALTSSITRSKAGTTTSMARPRTAWAAR